MIPMKNHLIDNVLLILLAFEYLLLSPFRSLYKIISLQSLSFGFVRTLYTLKSVNLVKKFLNATAPPRQIKDLSACTYDTV